MYVHLVCLTFGVNISFIRRVRVLQKQLTLTSPFLHQKNWKAGFTIRKNPANSTLRIASVAREAPNWREYFASQNEPNFIFVRSCINESFLHVLSMYKWNFRNSWQFYAVNSVCMYHLCILRGQIAYKFWKAECRYARRRTHVSARFFFTRSHAFIRSVNARSFVYKGIVWFFYLQGIRHRCTFW